MRWLLLLLPFSIACLGSTYRVPGAELDRIAALPREERGAVVRATQALAMGELEVDESSEVRVANDIVALTAVRHSTRARRASQRLAPHPRRVRAAPSPTRVRVQVASSPADGVGRTRVQVAGEGPSGPVVRRTGGSRSNRSGRSGSGGSGSGAKAGGAVVAIVLIAAAAAGVGLLALATSEGARYDGWVAVEPDHTLHLYQRQGQGPRLWIGVPIADLSPEVAAWADGAVLDPSEGRVLELGRAPLNRRGAVFSVLGMASMINVLDPDPTRDDRRWGGGSRISFGGFPIQHLGILAALDVQGASALNTRFGGELQGYFPEVGRSHFGLYFEGGVIRSRRDAGELTFREASGYYGGGALFQVDVTTRLALELRGGLWITDRRVFPTFGLGFAVY